jgi:hypothetical protein
MGLGAGACQVRGASRTGVAWHRPWVPFNAERWVQLAEAGPPDLVGEPEHRRSQGIERTRHRQAVDFQPGGQLPATGRWGQGQEYVWGAVVGLVEPAGGPACADLCAARADPGPAGSSVDGQGVLGLEGRLEDRLGGGLVDDVALAEEQIDGMQPDA